MSPLPPARDDSSPIRVLLCDPLTVRRAFIRDLLEREPAIEVIDELHDLEGIDLAAARTTPDVTIVATAGTSVSDVVLLARVRRLAHRGAVLALCDSDHREREPGCVTRLPRTIGPRGLLREVCAAARCQPDSAAHALPA